VWLTCAGCERGILDAVSFLSLRKAALRNCGAADGSVPSIRFLYKDGPLAAAFGTQHPIPGESKMPSPLTKSALIESITNLQADETTKRQVKSVVEALVTVGHKELKKSGVFLIPGFAKFVVVKKPATKARKGINPFTKEPTVFKARPARKVVKARPVKAIKDAIA
jgi:DNA-binding protein HU-beta